MDRLDHPSARSRRISLGTWALLAALGAIWGASFLAIRTALDEIPPLTSVAHRVVWAALALWLVALWRGLRAPCDLRLWAAYLAMGLLNNVIPFSLMAWGQLHIETGLTAILNAGTAIWGVLAAALFFAEERLTALRALGVSVGFVGVILATGFENLTAFDPRALAQLAVLAAGVSYALAGVWARARLGGAPPLVNAAGMLTASAAVALPLSMAVEGPPRLALQAETWAAIAYYALVSTALAYVLYYRILAAAGPAVLLVVTLISPPIAVALGAAVRAEALPIDAFVGFGVLAVGLGLLGAESKRAP